MIQVVKFTRYFLKLSTEYRVQAENEQAKKWSYPKRIAPLFLWAYPGDYLYIITLSELIRLPLLSSK
jgi:hypothetical protein